MIVLMSKVEIAGQKDVLEDVLSVIQHSGLLQIEANTTGFIKKKDWSYIDSFLPDKSTLSEQFFLEDLKSRIEELFYCLTVIPLRPSYIDPRPIIDTIYNNLQRHLASCRDLSEKRDTLKKESDEINRYTMFLDAVEPLLKDIKETSNIEFIGMTLRDDDSAEILKSLLKRETDNSFELLTSRTRDDTLAGVIVIAKKFAEKIKRSLTDKNIPELAFPSSYAHLPLPEKILSLKKRNSEILDEIDVINMQLDSFSNKWGAIYKKSLEWINDRLSVFRAAASVFESEMCFFIYGWMASRDVRVIREKLKQAFSGRVLIEELEISEEDFEKIPVLLKNPAYFKPFELFTRLLPLPRYTSYDPTPFIGIFLPVFFGMILGDAGYGLILMVFSLVMLRTKKYKDNPHVQDAAKILFLSSAYAACFGVLYGEYFGELGHTLLGLEPFFIERRTAIIPTLYFSLTVGIMHIIFGTLLGFISDIRKKSKKHAFSRLLQIAVIICLLLLVASMFGYFPSLMTRPIILVILFLTPFLIFTGGILAPLELIKSIGNIISYVRIMAIGLTSVLLAYVANRLAGMTGDIIIGIVVAGLLHILNIIIGIFSPAIHSLRLHYVEFFSKFIEPGGKKFKPLRKEEEILWKPKKFL